jgi:putative DNA primase/helicase
MNDASQLPRTATLAGTIHGAVASIPQNDEARNDAGLSKSAELGGELREDANTAIAPDLDEAARFLALLGESHTFQTFDDGPRKDHALARILHGTFAQHAATLSNLNARGAGVFVTVNATDGRGRKAENIQAVRAAFVDLDGAPLNPVQAFFPKPHCIVETSPGRFHAYWLCDGLPLAEFKATQQAIALRFDGDKSVCDLPRVMRLPGFVHRKRDPFVSRIVAWNEGTHHDASLIRSWFPTAASVAAEKQLRQINGKPKSDPYSGNPPSELVDSETLADLRDALKSIPADDRKVWVAMGHALKNLGAEGYELWRDWSKTSEKFDNADCWKRWQGFTPERTSHTTVFAEAMRCGWKNPRSGARDGRSGVVVADDGTVSVPTYQRPCYVVFDEEVRTKEHGKLRPGVWHFTTKPKGDGFIPLSTWIASPLHIEAVTHDATGNNFGRLLRLRNTNGKWREWAMPMALLAARGDELCGELLAMGVHIDPKGHADLIRYLQAETPARRVRCVAQTGWSGAEFILPDGAIGPNPEGVALQTGERMQDEFTCAGTLDGWQAGIAARAVGNPVLMLALSAAFAGPLLAKANAEGGGLHFVGDSSTGKTTALDAACSVWGGPGYKRSWRATANGMEGAAAMFNDCLLALDEISECDPREVGAIVYALGNGAGKQRAARTGSARGVVRWRCFVLSSGERTIETAMAEGGNRAKAGQGVRLLNVEVARTFGAWDALHGLANGGTLSDAIKTTAAAHFGHAGRAFLRHLTADSRDWGAAWGAIKALSEFNPTDGEGQDKRAAGRFALVALAGEVATSYGLTGWPEGEATRAAVEAFKTWRGHRGKGNDERRQVCAMLSDFIAKHGDSRFSSAEYSSGSPVVHNRAGWWRGCDEDREYLFNAPTMREALPGFDLKRALSLLVEVGALIPNASGERSQTVRIEGTVTRVYAIKASALELLP